jgi:hypothetical protein
VLDDGSTTITTTATMAVPTSTADADSTDSGGYVGSETLLSTFSLVATTPIPAPTLGPTSSSSVSPNVITPTLIPTSLSTLASNSAITTIIQTTVSCTQLCTTYYNTIIRPIIPAATPSTNGFAPPGSTYGPRPNSYTIYAPPGGWPFQRTSTLTSTDRSTATPSVDSARTNRILRPAGRPAGNRIADSRVKDEPMSHMLGENVFVRRSNANEEEASAPKIPAFSIVEFFTKHPDIDYPEITASASQQKEARGHIKISKEIAKVILNTDETLNPNSALLRKMRPHLAISPRQEQNSPAVFRNKEIAPSYAAAATTQGIEDQSYVPYEEVCEAPKPMQSHFHVEGPYEKAILGLLVVLVVGSIAATVAVIVRKRTARPFSRV